MFPTVGGANEALDLIHGLQSQHLVKLHDASVVYWPAGQKNPSTRQLVDPVSAGTVSGMFLGLLFGAIILTPIVGMAVGAGLGALRGAFRDNGIDDAFISQIRGRVTEGTSAFFLMTSDAVVDRVADAMKGKEFEIAATNLSKEQEQKLREAFGHK
jgi:uncharacterized membrane protein